MNSFIPWVGGKGKLLWIINKLMPDRYTRFVDVFGGSGTVTMCRPIQRGCMEVYNDFNGNLTNLFCCVKNRPMALLAELGFLPLNTRDDFNVLYKFFSKGEFTDDYLQEEMDLTEVYLKPPDAEAIRAGKKKPTDIPDEDRDFYLERRYPAFGNLCPRDIASRAAKERCDAGYGVGTGNAVYLDFKYAIQRLGADVVRDRYGNLFDMYQMISDDNPYETPMMIFPASHYTMGGIWVDYELQTSIKGLFAIGECNFSDHGANRLGASALMQGLADGYFVLPYTMQNYLSDQIKVPRFSTDTKEFDEAEKGVRDRIARLMAIKGTKSPDQLHKKLGHVMWNLVGMGRTLQSLVKAVDEIAEVRKEFYSDLRIVGSADDLNTELEKALRLEDFLVIAKMMAIDALHRNESCGAHFREEYQTADGEAARNDKDYMYVGCWKYMGDEERPVLLKEPLKYEAIQVQTRNYKS